MRIISWNCQGEGNPERVRAFKRLLRTHKLDIAFIMETKKLKSKSSNLCNISYLTNNLFVDCTTSGGGKAGGLGLLWNPDYVNIEIKDHDFNYIDFLVTDSKPNSIPWRVTGIYGYPKHNNKYQTCSLITDLASSNYNKNWLLFGDFNINLYNSEKLGGNPIDDNLVVCFKNTIDVCGLQDLGYQGNPFTWANNHDPKTHIQSRLIDLWLPMSGSNCSPILKILTSLNINLITVLYF